MATNTGLYNSIKTVTGARVSATSNALKVHVNADRRATTLPGKIQALAELVGGNIIVLNGTGAEMANLSNRQNGRTRIYYLTYIPGTGFTPGKKPGPSPSATRAASLAAAIVNGLPKNMDKKRGPSDGWRAAGTLQFLGQTTGVPLYQKKDSNANSQKYFRLKGTDVHKYTYNGWKIIGDDLVWVGAKPTVNSDKIARAIAEAAIRIPAVAGHVNMSSKQAGLFARIFSRGASAPAVRSVMSSARVANAIRNALKDRRTIGGGGQSGGQSGGGGPRRSVSSIANAIRNAIKRGTPSARTPSARTPPARTGSGPRRSLSSIANAFRNAIKGRRAAGGQPPPPGGTPPPHVKPEAGGQPPPPGGTPPPHVKPEAGGKSSNGKPEAGGKSSNGKPASNHFVFTNNKKNVLDVQGTLNKFHSTGPGDEDVVKFYNKLVQSISNKERNNQLNTMFARVITRLDKHLSDIFDIKNNRTVLNRFLYYEQNLAREELKSIARKYIKKYKNANPETKPPGAGAPPPKSGLSFPSLFGGRNNIHGAINYANRQERAYRGYNRGFGPPAPSFNTRRAAPSLAGTAPPPPAAFTFPALPAEQRAALAAQVSRNLTPNQKRVVNTAGGAQLVANIVAKAGGANKVKQAATALQTYTKNNAVRMGLTTNIAANAVIKLGGPMNAATAAAITNKIFAAMNQKVVANRAAVTRKKKRKSKPKPKPAPEAAPIRARLLNAMVKKFTKNELVKIAGENALGSKNNKTKNMLVKHFTKFMRRQPKGGKKGSVTNHASKKTKK